MKSKYFFIMATLLLLISRSYEYKSNEIITISFYYSTLSAASKNFIVNQLLPSFSKLGQYLKLDFLPYGGTNVSINENGTYVFQCTRGPKDCEGNIIQSCALNQTEDDHTRLQFVYCYMINAKKHNASDHCANAAGLNKKLINKCRTENGKDILIHLGERVRQELPENHTLPKVKLDGKFVYFERTNFVDNLCEILKDAPECHNISTGGVNTREINNKNSGQSYVDKAEQYYKEMMEQYRRNRVKINRSYYVDMVFNPNSTELNGVPTYNIFVEDKTRAPAIEDSFDFDGTPKFESEETNPYVKSYNVSANNVLGLGKAISKIIGESHMEREQELKAAEKRVSSGTVLGLGGALSKIINSAQKARKEE